MTHTPMMRSLIRALQLARRKNLEANGEAPPIPRERISSSRRHFLKLAGAAGALGVIPGALPRAVLAAGDRCSSIAVVGAGLAGLNAAYQLQKAGVRADVYEANLRAGGRVFSRTDLLGPGLVTEMGGEFINTDHDDMLALAEEFGLSLFDRRTDVETLTTPTSAYYFSNTDWSESDLAELLRPLAEQITHDAERLDANWARYAPKFDRYTVTDYLDHHAALIPQPFIRTLIENTIRTEYGAEAAQSSALQLLFLLPSVDGDTVEVLGYSDEAYTVKGGNGLIIEGLANALDGRIHYGMALNKIESEHKNSFKLHFANGEHVRADHVILAVPFTVLRHIELEVPLPGKLRQFIHEVDLGANEKVHARYAQRQWRQQAFSLEAWTDLGFSEVWDGSQRQADRADGVLTYFLGGKEVEQAHHTTGGILSVGSSFTHALDRFVSGLEVAATGKYVGTHWTQNPFSHGAYVNFKPGQLTRFGDYFWIESDVPGESQEVSVGRLVFAGEHLSDEYYGFMNGAAQTGRLAAGVVLRQLRGRPSCDKHVQAA